MAVRRLDITIDLELHETGPNRTFHHEVQIEVPPDYNEADILPFVRWRLDLAAAELQREQMGEARSARFLAAYDLRMRIIQHLIRTAARDHRTQVLVAKVQQILDLGNDDLEAQWGPVEEED